MTLALTGEDDEEYTTPGDRASVGPATLAQRARIELEALLLKTDGPAHRHVTRAIEEIETVAAIVKDGIPQERCPVCGSRINLITYADLRGERAIESHCESGHVFSVRDGVHAA